MHSRHSVSVLRTLFEPALLELQRGPIELVDQLGMPLPQPFLGQELSGQTLEPRDDPAVVGIHAATPLLPSPRPRGVWLMRGTRADGQRPATALRRPAIQYSGGIALHLARPNTGRLTFKSLVSSAGIARGDHFARRCGAFTTYRRVSFSPASTIDSRPSVSIQTKSVS